MSTSDERAREIFRQHDGFAFHIEREGLGAEYRAFAVPPETEREWLDELAVEMLARLDRADNDRVVRFFSGHNDLTHLDAFIAAGPRGRLRQRCAYLESMTTYVDRVEAASAGPTEETGAARDWIAARAQDMLTDQRISTSQARVERIIERSRRTA